MMIIIKYYYVQLQYDTRVRVSFQDNAWCNEQIMRQWIIQQWKPACSGDMLLALDVHKAQTTEAIQDCLKEECNTYPVYVPAGTTSIVQPVDVVFNAPFKAAVERQATKHLQENLDSYVQGTINASERRVLITKWVGSAWEELSTKTDMVIRSFIKCGISVPPDGSRDDEINLNGLEDYTVDSEDEGDPFSDEDDVEDPSVG